MKTFGIIALVAVLTATGLYSCSRETREDAIDRAADAARALNGGDTEGRTPDIVRKQQEAERRRQNTEWTAENQKKHPIEYCQAQIEELDKMSVRLEVEAHKLGVMRAEQSRKAAENASTVAQMEKQLGAAKEAYRRAEASDAWPMAFNGHALAKEKAQAFIVETHARLEGARARVEPQNNLVSRIDRRLSEIHKEQTRLVRTKEKAKTTLSALQAQQVVDGEKGIADALASFNDSLDALSTWSDEPTFEDLSAPTAEAETASAFAAIMAE